MFSLTYFHSSRDKKTKKRRHSDSRKCRAIDDDNDSESEFSSSEESDSSESDESTSESSSLSFAVVSALVDTGPPRGFWWPGATPNSGTPG